MYGSGFGRRHAIWAAMGFICLGAVIQASAFSVPQLMVGRLITGLGTYLVPARRHQADYNYRCRYRHVDRADVVSPRDLATQTHKH